MTKLKKFSDFCKKIHIFAKCNFKHCENQFYINMLHAHLLKNTSVEKRKRFFTTLSLKWQNNFFFLLEKYNNKEYYLEYVRNNQEL